MPATYVFRHLSIGPQTFILNHSLQHVRLVGEFITASKCGASLVDVAPDEAPRGGAFAYKFGEVFEGQILLEGQMGCDPADDVTPDRGPHGRRENVVEGRGVGAEVVEVDAHGFDAGDIEDGAPDFGLDCGGWLARISGRDGFCNRGRTECGVAGDGALDGEGLHQLLCFGLDLWCARLHTGRRKELYSDNVSRFPWDFHRSDILLSTALFCR